MEQEPSTNHAYEPMAPDDFWLFIDAKSIQRAHRTRGQIPDSGHTAGERRRCPECQHLALGALLAYASRARERGWDREQAIADLREHPATYDSMAKEGRRRENPAMGRLAKPYEAAFGASYEKALRRAHAADLLAVSVRTAQEFLGFTIDAAQDEGAPVEHGRPLPFNAIAHRMASGPYVLPDSVTPEELWRQIVTACEVAGRAWTLLTDHVFRHSAAASRHTATHVVADDGSAYDPIAEASVERSITGGSATDADGIVAAAAAVVADLQRAEPTVAEQAVRRIVANTFGPDAVAAIDHATLMELVEDILLLARRELVVRTAASALRAEHDPSPERTASVVASTVASTGLEHPYDLSLADGRDAHERWLEVLQRDALHAARALRIG